MPDPKVGVGIPSVRSGDLDGLRRALASIAEAGLDHVGTGDHISFHTGAGRDGLITAASLAVLHPTLAIYVAVYLLPLRHPVLVARQLSTLSSVAAGRLIFGVGVGGEDRHEVEVCGVDPGSRGRRMDECLQVLRGLSIGEPFSFHGQFFDLESALILPTPEPPIPIVVGGRSNAALVRAARFGDGWLGIWNSVRRFKEAVALIDEESVRAGRKDVRWQHAMQVWCGLGASREEARGYLAPAMESTYKIGFESFERYSPYGTPAEVAEFLAPYVEAGCQQFNLIPVARDAEAAIAASAEVKRLLR